MDPHLLNRMLLGRIRDLAAVKPARNRTDHEQAAERAKEPLLKALGLMPLPPKTDLKAKVTGIVERDGYRIEKLFYESRPSVAVTAHLYLPRSEAQSPVVLCPHGHWPMKKSEPVVQAQAIGLVLQGLAALVVDSPGVSWDDNSLNERGAIGSHDDAMLSMGFPVTGCYVWDLMRGLDYLETRSEVDTKRVGIAGASGGGLAATYAFTVDPRIQCAVPICYASSLETNPENGCLCNHVPGILALGDRADVLALRAPNPVMLVGATDDPEFPEDGHRKTYEKLRALYRLFGQEQRVRLEIVEGPHDLSRRMREAALAFFGEHLQGETARSYRPEKRPLTDSSANPWPANTEDPEKRELQVLDSSLGGPTFRDLLRKSLEEPYPSAFDANSRLVRWGRYGRLPALKPTAILRLSDEVMDGALTLPFEDVDQRSCIYLGLSVPEFFAQLLHLLLPGGPEGWEALASGGDVITSMIASMKTLVGGATAEVVIEEVVAAGLRSSMVARHFQALRPSVRIETSHAVSSWVDVLDRNDRVLAMPQARYLGWPT